MSPSPASGHQRIIVRLIGLLTRLVPDGDVLTAPMDVRLGGITVQPDVFWVAAESDCIDQGAYYLGPPDLVVEVLSPSNTESDRVTKFDLYEQHGVREYWIVEPREDYLEVYVLDGGTFRRLGAFKPGQTFDSPVLGKTVVVDQVF